MHVCAAVNPTQFGHRFGQRWYKTEHADTQWLSQQVDPRPYQHAELMAEAYRRDFNKPAQWIAPICDRRG
jgi:hypothetical protein